MFYLQESALMRCDEAFDNEALVVFASLTERVGGLLSLASSFCDARMVGQVRSAPLGVMVSAFTPSLVHQITDGLGCALITVQPCRFRLGIGQVHAAFG